MIKAGDDAKDIGNNKLDYFRSLNIENFKNELEEISETASKEFSNDNTMKKMKKEWEPLEFTCKHVPDKESYILDGEAIELIQATLDDHIIKT
jgi:dynein heavy chain